MQSGMRWCELQTDRAIAIAFSFVRSRQQWKLVGTVVFFFFHPFFAFIPLIWHREFVMLCVIASNKSTNYYVSATLLLWEWGGAKGSGVERGKIESLLYSCDQFKWTVTLTMTTYWCSVRRVVESIIIAAAMQRIHYCERSPQIIAFYLKIINRLAISFGAYLLSYYVIMKWDGSTVNGIRFFFAWVLFRSFRSLFLARVVDLNLGEIIRR